MPAISVIVPVYQAEALLPQCVESVLAQTFSDWELLLIDDGSRDGSPTLCDGYAARDPRIRVFHKPNGGVSTARNLGLEQATGPYIAFLDADDAFEPAALETLWYLREKAGADSLAVPTGQRDFPRGTADRAVVASTGIYRPGIQKDPLAFWRGTGFNRRCSTASSGVSSLTPPSSGTTPLPLRGPIWRMSCS